MDLNKILVPVDFPNPSPGMIHQAAFLARHFHSEIILLHVVPPLNYPAGMLESGVEITARDLHSEIVKGAQKELDELSRPELDGIAVRRLLLRGDPTWEIVRTARDEKVGLIVMSTHGHGALYRLLLGSVATKVLHDSDCPIWVTAHVEQTPTSEFGLQNVLCALDLSSHSPTTLSQAAQVPRSLVRGLRSFTLLQAWKPLAPEGRRSTRYGRRKSWVSPRKKLPGSSRKRAPMPK